MEEILKRECSNTPGREGDGNAEDKPGNASYRFFLIGIVFTLKWLIQAAIFPDGWDASRLFPPEHSHKPCTTGHQCRA
jgi:hypothetical protein